MKSVSNNSNYSFSSLILNMVRYDHDWSIYQVMNIQHFFFYFKPTKAEAKLAKLVMAILAVTFIHESKFLRNN